MMSVDILALHKKAGESAKKFIAGVKDEQWNTPSNCEGWSVRDVVNHIVSENLWVPDLLEGKTIAEVGDVYDGDVLHDNPLISFEQSQIAAQESIEGDGALEKIVHLSYGDLPANIYIGHRIVDLVVHGWDVAKSTNQEDLLDGELVKAAFDIMKPDEAEWRPSGAFGEQVEVSEDADLQTKLLALLGRKR